MSVVPTAGNEEALIGLITRSQSRKLPMEVVANCNGRELWWLTHLARGRLRLVTSMKLGFWAGRVARNGRPGPNLEYRRPRLDRGEFGPGARLGTSLAYLNTRRRAVFRCAGLCKVLIAGQNVNPANRELANQLHYSSTERGSDSRCEAKGSAASEMYKRKGVSSSKQRIYFIAPIQSKPTSRS
jgi:hypothetical protein